MSLSSEERLGRPLAVGLAADDASLIRRFGRASVLVVGDVMLDRYVYGQVNRISPEAPVPVVTVEREVAMAGGAGNVVRNLTALGAAAAFVSVVGDDQAGSDVTALIGGQPGVEPWLLVQGARTTTVKTRYFAQGQQLLRADQEETGPIHGKLAERLLRIARDAMAATSITVISDYCKGVLTGELPAQLIAAAREAGRRTIVDPKCGDYARFAGADLITPNRRELADATGLSTCTEAEIVSAAQHLRKAHEIGAVLVTRAEDGMTLVNDSGSHHFPASETPVVDVSGAGDAVVATLAAAIAGGLDLLDAVRLANVAAGIVVGKIGTAVVQPGELLAALTPEGSTLRKIVGRPAMIEQVARWRRRGARIGFTNGCFDPVIPAHVHALEQARTICDRLVVGLNGDASTRRLRGANRPMQPEATRAAGLANLPVVDLVCVFEEDTAIDLLTALRPDVLIKGVDYGLDQVVGAELVRSWGGFVVPADSAPAAPPAATVTRLRG